MPQIQTGCVKVITLPVISAHRFCAFKNPLKIFASFCVRCARTCSGWLFYFIDFHDSPFFTLYNITLYNMMYSTLYRQSLFTLANLSPQNLLFLLDLAQRLKKRKMYHQEPALLTGKNIALVFAKL